MRKALFWLSLLMIFAIPLENTIDVQNVGTVSRALGLLVASLWVVTVLASGQIRTPHPFHVAFLLFVLWNGATLLWSNDVNRSLDRMMTWVQLIVFVFIIWDVFTTRAAVRAGLQAYVLGAGLCVASVIRNYLMGIENSYQRYSATGFNSAGFAVILALGVPIACYLAAKKTESRAGRGLRLANYAYIPLALLGIGLAGTRGAMLALAPGAIFGLWTLQRLRTGARVFVLLLLAAGIFAVQAVVPSASFERLAETGQELRAGDLSGRVRIWRESLVAASSRPFVGVGTGAFARATQTSPRSKKTGAGKVAHNSFLSIQVESGAIGLLGFGLVLLIVVRQALVQPRLESRFWISMLLTWVIVASAMTYEHKKQTWLVLAMTVASASARGVRGAGTGTPLNRDDSASYAS